MRHYYIRDVYHSILDFFLLRIIEHRGVKIPSSYFVYGLNTIRFQQCELEIWKIYSVLIFWRDGI